MLSLIKISVSVADFPPGASMGRRGKDGSAGLPAAGALKKDVRNPDALRTRTSGSDAVREAKVQAATKAVFKGSTATYGAAPPPLLQCTDLVPDQPGFIVVVRELLGCVECGRLCAAIDDVGLNMPNGADLNPRKNEAFLKRQSLSFVDPYLQSVIFQRMQAYFPPIRHNGAERRAVGFDGSMRFYKYERGDQFGQHVDVSTRGCAATEETEYTLLIYLNGGGEGAPLEGGETIFWKTKAKQLCVFAPERGVALLHGTNAAPAPAPQDQPSHHIGWVLTANRSGCTSCT